MRRNTFAGLVLTLLVGALGCAKTPSVRLVPNPDFPAAVGSVTATKTDNNNTAVTLKVEHLAPANLVAAGATTYVVWARPTAGEDRHPHNLGALRVHRDRSGSLETITPLVDFEIFITAEQSPAVSTPSRSPIMQASIHRPPG